MPDIVLTYATTGMLASPVADGRACDQMLERIITIANDRSGRRSDQRATLSTSNIFWAVKVAVKQGKIQPERVTFVYGDQTMTLDKEGVHTPHVPGFLDYEMGLLDQFYGGGDADTKIST